MKTQFTAMLTLALASSMLSTGYCENVIESVPKEKPHTQQVIKKNIAKNTITVSPSPTTVQTAHTTKPVVKSADNKSFPFKQPVPVKYMQAPDPQSFQPVVKSDYHLSVPTNFGPNPLSDLPGTDGPMLLRIHNNTLFMAVNVIDPEDTSSFNPTGKLPIFEQKHPLVNWIFGSKGTLKCIASEYNGFYGNSIIVEAIEEANGKTYQLVYSFPATKVFEYLPTVLYSLNSFKPI